MAAHGGLHIHIDQTLEREKRDGVHNTVDSETPVKQLHCIIYKFLYHFVCTPTPSTL